MKSGTTQVFKEKNNKSGKMQVFTSTIGTEGHKKQIEDMVNAINEGKEPMINGEEGRKSLEIVLAAYESAKSAKSVNLSFSPS